MKLASRSLGIGSLVFYLIAANAVSAQIVPDNTLPVNSRVEAGCTTCTIDGGTTRGTNLFHSFREFSVPTGGTAFFNNATQVQNILTRVTGSSISNIDGLLRTNGTANLFLLNPNGVIFGPNARLDVRGSFVTTTANAIAFPNGETFSASNPTPPSALLTINPNALLFNQLNPQPIISRSTANSTGLSVDSGRSLLLVGGDVRLVGGRLTAPGGRIELGGLSEPGAIGLALNGNIPSLAFPVSVARADVSLVNGALIDVVAGSGGSASIMTRNLNILDNSAINAGIGTGFGAVDSQAGDIEINATGAIAIDGGRILNNVRAGSVGKGGNIRITTGSLSLTNVSLLSASTRGRGDAGNIFIDARDTVSFDGAFPDDNSPTSVLSSVEGSGAGQGGDIRITARFFSLTNGAQLGAVTQGRGDAGNVFINARDAVFIDRSAISSSVERTAVGQGGNVDVSTNILSLTNGGQLISGARGQGDGGNIFVNARSVFFDGIRITLLSTSSEGLGPSGVFSSVSATGTGQGGNIYITTDSLSVANGAQLVASTGGQGIAGDILINARDTVSFDGIDRTGRRASGAYSSVQPGGIGQGGNIRIAAESLSLRNGARLSTATFGQGNAGNIFIDARIAVSFDGAGLNGSVATTAASAVGTGGIGQGGNIRITTGSFLLTNGGQLTTTTFGRGNAGNIFIDARDTVSFDGTSSNGDSPTSAFSAVQENGIGRGGNIRIATGSLSLTNGGQLVAGTRGQGDAGNIFVDARGSISFDGRSRNGRFISGVLSNVNPLAIGAGGNITLITLDSLAVTNGATISASSAGTGGAGSIRASAPSLQLDQGKITSETASGKGGNIDLTVQDILLLRRGSLISSTAGTAQAGGDGGNIRFNGGFIVAVPSENSDITANAFTGSGGRVDITAQELFGIEFRPQLTPLSDITASSEFGIAGIVTINTPNVDPNRGLVELPTDLTDASNQIVSGCSPTTTAQTNRGEFYQTGRGGIAPLPTDALGSSDILEDLQPPNTWTATAKPTPIIEAQDWQTNDRGEVILVASKHQKPCQPRKHY